MLAKKRTSCLGAHMSIAGGFDKAVERGESVGCTAMQIFTKSNRIWHVKHLEPEQVANFQKQLKNSPIEPKNVIAHASYLINIGSSQAVTLKRSIHALREELTRSEELNIPGLVLHPGSATGASEEDCLRTIAQSLDQALEQTPGQTKILLETMAGQGSSVCYRFEQIAEIIKLSSHKRRIGVCVDTCHIFAAGYDISTPATYKKTWAQFDQIIGLDRLHAIHVNDSKKPLGSRVDRHADIGKGEIGLEAFRLLMHDERFVDIPKILEIPETTEMMADYKRNLHLLENL